MKHGIHGGSSCLCKSTGRRGNKSRRSGSEDQEEQEKKEQEKKNQAEQLPEIEQDEETKIVLPAEVLQAINSTGLDRKEHEIRVRTAVHSTPCLILDYSTGRYCRVSMSETNDPPENTTEKIL